MSIWLTLAAVLPGLVISFFIFYIDKYDRENWLPLVLCFILGGLITWPALYLQEFFEGYGIGQTDTLWAAFVYAMVGIALNEEVCKFFCVLIYPFHRRFFNEPMDGIVFSVLVGMGFATLENLLYADAYGLETIIVRAVTAVPAHGAFGVIAGYYIGLAKFQTERRFFLFGKGLLLAILLHGIYDFFLLQEVYSGLMGMALLFLYIGIRYSRRLIKLHLAASPFQTAIPETEEQNA